jgi:hypothetical protein
VARSPTRPNEYGFVDRWFVRASPDDTYEVVGDNVGYPSWWGFRWNHSWAMTRGERGVNALFDRRGVTV